MRTIAKVPYAMSNGSLTARVQLENASNVYLVDQTNFHRIQRGQKFSGYGGYFDRNPVVITVNKPGRFYLYVERGQYKYSFH